jgi:hypothetical protein
VQVPFFYAEQALSFPRADRDVSVDAIVAPIVIHDLTNTIVQWIRLHASGLITTAGDMLLTHEI